jgi:hypothetical protein
MPLLDHFHPPFNRLNSWRTFHGTWAVAIARLLNAGGLPPGYRAAPFADRDGPIEIDVATLHTSVPEGAENGASGAQPWSPGEPQLSVAVAWPSVDDVRVEVLTDDGDPRLAAAIELVSPRNKDREKAREAFAAKCAEHLRRGCGVVVIDVVTTRHADMHAEVLAMLEADAPATSSGLIAVSYRSVGRDAAGRLLAWPFALEVGKPLPTAVPLWLNGEFSVQLDLEASHTAACADLGIRQAGLRVFDGTEG